MVYHNRPPINSTLKLILIVVKFHTLRIFYHTFVSYSPQILLSRIDSDMDISQTTKLRHIEVKLFSYDYIIK